jgi:hypothetical protein
MRGQAYQVRWGPDDSTKVQLVHRQMQVAMAKGEPGSAEAAGILAAHDESDQARRSGYAVPTEHAFTVAPAAE